MILHATIVNEAGFMIHYYSDVGKSAELESGATHSLLFE
jgi:hypothetical protein